VVRRWLVGEPVVGEPLVGEPLVVRDLGMRAGRGGQARPTGRLFAEPLSQIWLLVTALAVTSVGLGLLVLPRLPTQTALPHLPLLVLASIFAAAELMRVHLHFRGEAHTITLGDLALVLALMFGSPPELLVAQVVGIVIARAVGVRQSVVKHAFNVAVAALDACLAVLIFRALVEVPAPVDPVSWLAAALAATAATVCSAVMVAAVIGISDRQLGHLPILETLGPSLVITAVNSTLGLAIGVVLFLNPLSALLLVGPAILTVIGYRAYTSQVEERHRRDLLTACSRILDGDATVAARVADALELCRETLRAGSLQMILWARDRREHDAIAPDAPSAGLLPLAKLASDGHARSYDGRHGDPELGSALAVLNIAQAMVAPVRDAEGVAGALVALDRLGAASRYTAQDERVMSAIAEQVTRTLQNDALTSSLQKLTDMQSQLARQANHDSLTDLMNRRGLTTWLSLALAGTHSAEQAPAVVLFDLDNFKQVNDTLGHGAGDHLLRVVAERLTAALREGDVAARFGGDEFVVLLTEPLTMAAAATLAARLQDAVCGPVQIGGRDVQVRASFGVALAIGSNDVEGVLKSADQAMYIAKRRGDGVPWLYGDEDFARDEDRRGLQQDLAVALENHQIRVAYQPVVSLATRKVTSVEALARWDHPTRGPISPEVFIALAEETGQVVKLGRQIVHEACRQLALWQRDHPRTALSVSVNLSVRELLEPNVTEVFAEILRDTGADPRGLVLEITESNALRREETITLFLHNMRRLGVRVAIDDFGSGYASVNHLRRLPVDILKLDQSLVLGALHSQADAEICRAIIALASALQLSVIAEGIETSEHATMLTGLGCPLAQGYHFGRPDAAGAIDDLLLSHELTEVYEGPAVIVTSATP
jgi:diguanylate cyclase (GGDEF)-like protein